MSISKNESGFKKICRTDKRAFYFGGSVSDSYFWNRFNLCLLRCASSPDGIDMYGNRDIDTYHHLVKFMVDGEDCPWSRQGMNTIIESRNIGDWLVKEQNPLEGDSCPVLLLLHGWTGDENVMWIFARRLSQRYLTISPRGKFPTPSGGFGWQPKIHRYWPEVNDFVPSIEGLMELLNKEEQRKNVLTFKKHSSIHFFIIMGNILIFR